MATEIEKLLIVRPLGPQGPKVGIRIKEVGDMIAFDFAMGSLTENERRSIQGILTATQIAGLDVVDCSPMPPLESFSESAEE